MHTGGKNNGDAFVDASDQRAKYFFGGRTGLRNIELNPVYDTVVHATFKKARLGTRGGEY